MSCFANTNRRKAVERIRDYLVAQIKALRSPSINAQVLQQQNFLRYTDLYTFLARHQPQLSDESRLRDRALDRQQRVLVGLYPGPGVLGGRVG